VELTPQLEHHTVTVDDRHVRFTSRGPEDAEFAYVGLHGLMGGGDSFWPVIAGVSETWRVVLPDLPGCGGTETMQRPYKHDIDGYAGWLERFLRAAGMAGKKLVLASIATGAPIAIQYSWEHREQVVGLVLHLPFLGKPAIGAKWARPMVAFGLRTPATRRVVDALRSSDALMHRIILHEPPDAISELAERDIAHKQHADLEAAGELLHHLMLTDARAELRHLRQPMLILASEHDFSAPVPMLEEIVRGRPERKLYVYRGGQHSWNEEFIEEMNREIGDFIQTQIVLK
jgi:3-oxoadipate enol-lactonase